MATTTTTSETEVMIPTSGNTMPAVRKVRRRPTSLVVDSALARRTFAAPLIEALPPYIDDLTRDFGPKLYGEMYLDSQTSSTVDLLRLGALSKGYALAVHEDVPEADQKQAQEIVDFCQWNLNNLDYPLEQVLWELSSAVYLGRKLARKVYHEPGTVKAPVGPAKPLLLRDIRVKPHGAATPVVDATYTILSVLPTPNGQYGTITPIVRAEDGTIPGEDPSAWVIYSHSPVDRNPQGTSVFRNVYTEWWMKMQLKGAYLQFLSLQAIPAIKAKVPTGMPELVDEVDPATGVKTGRQVSAAWLLKNALEAVRNAGVVVSPADVDYLQNASQGDVFLKALEWLDKAIAKGITKQILATEEASYDTLGGSKTHQDTLSMPVNRLTAEIAAVMRLQILRPLVLLNYGEDVARRLTPDVQVAQVEDQDRAELINAVSGLQRAKYPITDAQYAALDEEMGIPVRDLTKPEEAPSVQAQAKQEAAQALAQQLNAKDAGQGDGGDGQVEDEEGQDSDNA